MKNWFWRKIVLPLLALLRQGITPEKLALSIAFGFVLGVFPALGTTTLLCTGAALLLRLNLPAIQLVNYLVYPLQLALLVPFLQAGSRVMGAAAMRLSIAEVLMMLQTQPWALIRMLWAASVGAIAIWLVLSPFVAAAIYLLLVPVLRRLRTDPPPSPGSG
jgi:uncharacterized protein (DUF2062 family)